MVAESVVSVSVITVTYNAGALLRATIDSVLAQNSTDMEHIIVDGESKDQTGALIEAMKPLYAAKGVMLIFICERDNGIYDAMNKGMRHASGRWLNFLNAGDTYASAATISWVLQHREFDFLCGSARTVDSDRNVLGVAEPVENLTLDSFRTGSGVCHQAWFQRRELAPPYDQRLVLSADYRWIIECFNRARNCVVSRRVLVNYLYGGVSKQKYFITVKEKIAVMRAVFGLGPTASAILRLPLALARAWWLGPLKHYLLRRLGRYEKL